MDAGLRQICGRWKKTRNPWLDKKEWVAQNRQEGNISGREGQSPQQKPAGALHGVSRYLGGQEAEGRLH